MTEFVTSKKASEVLGLNTRTLQRYDAEGKIEVMRTAGGRRRYNLKRYLLDNNIIPTELEHHKKHKVIYCRVSSSDRKDDLQRQINYLLSLYPDHEVISDIASGINFKRKGLRKIIDLAITNDLEEVVITYKDRLCRIGYELLEFILTKYSNAIIKIIHDTKDETKSEEITKDLIEIITVYSSKLHGARNNKPRFIAS